jgi:hypothetical protein
MTFEISPEELAERLDTAALAFRGPWWWCPTFDAVRRQRGTEPVVVALTGMAEMMRSGEDPNWVAGGDSARAAVNEAGEWLEAGVDPTQVANWLRAGCYRPQAALDMAAAGIDVRLLLDEHGQPRHLVEAPNGWPVALALAVAEGDVSVTEALALIRGEQQATATQGE